MKRTQITLVALLALTVSTSAFAAGGKGREGKGKDGRDVRETIGAKVETAGASKAKAETVQLVRDISNGMRIESAPVLQSLNLKAGDIVTLNNKTAEAYDKGLFGSQQGRLFDELKQNVGSAEFQALFANYQIMAAKNLLTTANTKMTFEIEGKTHEVNSMDFLTGEALSVAKTSTSKPGEPSKFTTFLNRKSALEKEGKSSKDAIEQALREVGISLKEFVQKCLVKA